MKTAYQMTLQELLDDPYPPCWNYPDFYVPTINEITIGRIRLALQPTKLDGKKVLWEKVI